MTLVYINVIKRGRHVLVAVCDEEVLGKTLNDGKVEFQISERFYKGEKVTLDEAIARVREATSANLVGHNVVKKATLEGLIHPKAIIHIAGIPHAQMIML